MGGVFTRSLSLSGTKTVYADGKKQTKIFIDTAYNFSMQLLDGVPQ